MTTQTQNIENGQGQWADYTDLPVGEILRRTRVYYNLSLRDVERQLHIRASHLGALEDGNHKELPGRAYAIGFIRAYAEYLGLDGDKIVHLFKSQFGNTRVRREINIPAPASESKSPNIYILGVSLLAMALTLGGLAFLGKGEEGAEGRSIPMLEKIIFTSQNYLLLHQMPLEAAMVGAVEAAVGAAGPAAIVEPEARIVITAIDSSWIEIRNADGKALISRILKQDDKYLVPDEPGLVLDTGNIGALQFAVDGAVTLPLGQKGDVRRNVSLVPETFSFAPTPIESN